MISRRQLVKGTLFGGAGLALSPLFQSALGFAQNKPPGAAPELGKKSTARYKMPVNFGIGGTQLGNASVAISDEQARSIVDKAWSEGVRYFDTSPFYGYGLSERRYGAFLDAQKRSDYILSTKVGRIFKPGKRVAKSGNWIEPSPFDYNYDYTASGTRRSIEDSLQRLGIESIDIVLVHDLAPSNKDLGSKWKEQFEVAKNGAFKELAKMKQEGIIKAWGLGVNDPEPILATLQVAEPDVVLAAIQYSLMNHEEALNKTFVTCQERNVGVIVGAPFNNGFITGADRYNYDGKIPKGFKEKRAQMAAIAKKHKTDLRTAALQFCAAHPAAVAVLPGARSAEQAVQNEASMKVDVPVDFWAELKSKKLIAENAPVSRRPVVS